MNTSITEEQGAQNSGAKSNRKSAVENGARVLRRRRLSRERGPAR
jgi:hypothetical protein